MSDIISTTDEPLYFFHQGKNYKAYNLLGSHPATKDGARGYIFRVWAPRAKSVALVGDFNGWDRYANPMFRMIDGQTFECFVPNLPEYAAYKYCIEAQDGRLLYKADPYAFHAETPVEYGSNSSKTYNLDGYIWSDKAYLDKQKRTNIYASPVNIYEVNLFSWKRHEDGNYYTYKELAVDLVDYVKEMGYTHVEFMPLTEFPYNGSWGYQVTGFFAITSRLGTPKDFMALVDAFHVAGIGVILDWVPGHFPKDDFGLFEFDGQPLYEPSSWDRKECPGWGTRKFDYGRAEVLSFLISSAVFLFEKYHLDGLRVDAVASMLYLDFDKAPHQWLPNIYGDNKNLEAISFIRQLNEAVFSFFPNAMMIAEESTAWPMVTKPTDMGGLGFNFKWNMGWMNDVLFYIKKDPIYRRFHHDKLTFPMMYAFHENFVLPISHDEVVYGKGSLINKMPGNYDDKFAGVRSFLGYMISHPGKKLNFMGSEIGQWKEWDYNGSVEFFLKQFPSHDGLSKTVKDLNHFYKNTPAFYEIEDGWEGFEWLAVDDKDSNFIAYKRQDKNGNQVLALINFSGQDHIGYRLGVKKGKYQVVFNSDDRKYGGNGNVRKFVYNTTKSYCHQKEYSIVIDIPKFTCLYLEKII